MKVAAVKVAAVKVVAVKVLAVKVLAVKSSPRTVRGSLVRPLCDVRARSSESRRRRQEGRSRNKRDTLTRKLEGKV